STPWVESKSELSAIGGKMAVDERRRSPGNDTKARPEAARLRTASSPAGVVLLRPADQTVDLQRFSFGRHDAAAEPANHLVHLGADDQGVGLGDSFEERDKLEVYCVGDGRADAPRLHEIFAVVFENEIVADFRRDAVDDQAVLGHAVAVGPAAAQVQAHGAAILHARARGPVPRAAVGPNPAAVVQTRKAVKADALGAQLHDARRGQRRLLGRKLK